MIIVFHKVETYLILSPALSLILDFNPVSLRPILTHPDSDSSLGFNNDSKIWSGFLKVDKPLQVIAFSSKTGSCRWHQDKPSKALKLKLRVKLAVNLNWWLVVSEATKDQSDKTVALNNLWEPGDETMAFRRDKSQVWERVTPVPVTRRVCGFQDGPLKQTVVMNFRKMQQTKPTKTWNAGSMRQKKCVRLCYIIKAKHLHWVPPLMIPL